MGKIEQVVKSEVVRLVRKEMRATCVPLAREVRELKRAVATLQKAVAPLEKLGAQILAERTQKKAKLEAPREKVKTARLSPGLIKKLRTRLGLTQAELAMLVGVSGPAVAFWERGRSRPTGHSREALVALRGLGKREIKKILAEKKAQTESASPKSES